MRHPLRILLLGLCPVLVAGCTDPSAVWAEPPSTSAAGNSDGRAALRHYLDARAATADTAGAYRPYIALLPFTDDSGFRDGIFELEHEIPRFLTAKMADQTVWHTIPYEAIVGALDSTQADDDATVGQLLKADFVGRGRLTDYNFERLHAGDAMIGGYKSYKGTAEMEITLVRVSSGKALRTAHARKEVLDRGLGLDLLGKPRKQDLQFSRLPSTEFASEEFNATALGQATAEAAAVMVDELSALIRPTVGIGGDGAKILSVDEEEIFINLGATNGLRQGYRFHVLPDRARALNEALDPERALATVEVVDVIGSRLARVRRIGDGDIRVGDRLRFVQPPE